MGNAKSCFRTNLRTATKNKTDAVVVPNENVTTPAEEVTSPSTGAKSTADKLPKSIDPALLGSSTDAPSGSQSGSAAQMDTFLANPTKQLTITPYRPVVVHVASGGTSDIDLDTGESKKQRREREAAQLRELTDFAKHRPRMTAQQVTAVVASWPVVETHMQSIGVLAFVAIFQVGCFCG